MSPKGVSRETMEEPLLDEDLAAIRAVVPPRIDCEDYYYRLVRVNFPRLLDEIDRLKAANEVLSQTCMVLGGEQDYVRIQAKNPGISPEIAT